MSNIGYIDYRFIRLHVFCVVVADIVYKCYNTAPDPVSSKNNLQYRKYLHTIIISYSYVPYVKEFLGSIHRSNPVRASIWTMV